MRLDKWHLGRMLEDVKVDSRKWAVPTVEKYPRGQGESKLDCMEAYVVQLADEIKELWKDLERREAEKEGVVNTQLSDHVQNLIETCIEAVREADNGDYYVDGLASVEPIIDALKPFGITFGPEKGMGKDREVHRV